MSSKLGFVGAALATVGGLGAMAIAVRWGLRGMQPFSGLSGFGYFIFFACCCAGGVLCIVALARRHATNEDPGPGILGLVAAAAGIVGPLLGYVLAAASFTDQYSHGRPFRRGRKNRTAEVLSDGRPSSWLLDAAPFDDVPQGLRAALAVEWRTNGAKEHASVAAFSRLALDLLAVGAPPALLAEVQRDALDEIRHARLCFSIARDLDGRADVPGAFPEARTSTRRLPTRDLALSKLAIDAVIDGALNEGVSARILARLSKTSTPPRLAATIREMAADEARHAAHSWNVVAFCIEAGGPAVESALRGALRALPARMTAPIPEAARGGAWEAFGVQGEAMEGEAWASARRHAVERLASMVGATAAPFRPRSPKKVS